jgi:putative DNA primase/helicase
MDAFQQWIDKARGVPIELELDRRGVKLRRVGAEQIGPCPKCGGDDRFAVNTKKGVFNCRCCGAKGDVIRLVQFLDGTDFNAACTTLTGQPPPKANGKRNSKDAAEKLRIIVVATFEYRDRDGNVLFAVDRIEFQKRDGGFVLKDGKRDKVFRQRRPDPNHPGKWLPNVTGVPVVPYRLPQLLEAIAAGRLVLIVEGEAKADLLWSWNVAATCCSGGAKKWKPEHSEFLSGADIVLLPDNDNVGWEHANKVGATLVGIAKSVRVLRLPDLPLKGDIIDWHKAGGTHEQLDALLCEARPWQPPLETDDQNEKKTEAKRAEDELIENLAKIQPGIEFARERKRLAKDLDVTPRDIDAEVKAYREKASPLYGHWIVEPWPEAVDGDALLRDIIRRLRRHVVCSHNDALAIALWIMFAWVHDEIATHSPILDITSAEPESGKSTTLGLVSFLAPRCLPSVEISEAALYRSIELWQPSFAIDEFDTVLSSDDKAALRSVINSGHTRGQGVVKCAEPDFRPQHFKTFCPKAIGMVGRKLPASTISRCIVIELHRRKKDEQIEKFTHKDDDELADLRRRLRRWSMDNEHALRDAKPSMPEEFDNRRADNWRVMLAIADLCSGVEDWGDKARAAASAIECATDTRTTGVRLLAVIKTAFDQVEDGGDAIGSEDLVTKLTADSASEWHEWRSGKPITQAQLARLLKPFRIFPEQVRIGGRQVRGYLRARFADAWQRYL